LGEGEPLLFLHGAGTSTRCQFDPLRQQLWENRIQSVAFDFVGHGETGGYLQPSSLRHRFEQSCCVIEAMKLKEPFSIVAESMSKKISKTELLEIQNQSLY
jgi:uncharacterized protein